MARAQPPVTIRRLVTTIEEIVEEAGITLDRPLRRVAAGAVIRNPWVDSPFVEDLQPAVRRIAPVLARELSQCVLAALGGPSGLEAFGKAALVGVDGEIEHGAALLHTPHLADHYRTAVEGTSIITFGERRAEAGATLMIPMWHKTAPATRSHYQATELTIPDAPRADELVIAIAAASGPRPFPRIGDRKTDAVGTELAGAVGA
jgi:hypothetical protein